MVCIAAELFEEVSWCVVRWGIGVCRPKLYELFLCIIVERWNVDDLGVVMGKDCVNGVSCCRREGVQFDVWKAHEKKQGSVVALCQPSFEPEECGLGEMRLIDA